MDQCSSAGYNCAPKEVSAVSGDIFSCYNCGGAMGVGRQCYWCPVGRGQGCWPSSYRAWCSPLQQRILWLKMSGVLGLRNYALAKWVTRSCLLSWQAASPASLRHLFSLSVKYPLWPSHKDVGKNYKNNGWKAWSAVQVITIVKMWFFKKLKYSWFTVLYQSLLCCSDSVIHSQT